MILVNNERVGQNETPNIENNQFNLEATTVEINDLRPNILEIRQLTKKGEVRKRKKIDESILSIKIEKLDDLKARHAVKPPCNERCMLKCKEKLSEERRQAINDQFWNLSYLDRDRRTFVLNTCKRSNVKKRTIPPDEAKKRNRTLKYC